MIQYEDDYLPYEEHKIIQDYFMGKLDHGDIDHSCVWTYQNGIASPEDGHFQFVQQVFCEHTIISPAFKILKPILIKEKVLAIARIKANLVLKTEKLKVFDNAFHTDLIDTTGATTAIYYVNSNNGYTLFEDGTKVKSVANRLVRFPCNLKHTGTTCTDQNRRLLVNFNYFTYGN